MRAGGERGGETSSGASLTQGFGSGAEKTSGHATGAPPRRGSVQLRGSHARCQAQSQPAQHPSARLGPQVSLCSGLLLCLAAALIFLTYCIFLSLIPSSFPLLGGETLVFPAQEMKKRFRPSLPEYLITFNDLVKEMGDETFQIITGAFLIIGPH